MLDFIVAGQPLLLLGILFTLSFGLTILFSKLNLPHILFYLAVGIIGGNILFPETINSPEIQSWFHFVEIFALGLIGFQIGTELHFYLMRREPKLITVLLIANVAGAFILTYITMIILTGNMIMSIMLAALATSTAPATTVGVIKKLQAKGKLTQRVQWILAFDDVVSVAIVEAILVISVISLGGDPSISAFLLGFGKEIGLAVVIGLFVGLGLNYVIERIMQSRIEMMELTFGVIMLSIGLAEIVHTSAITTTMVIGATATNTGGDNYKDAHELLDVIMSPILALFFILIGAKVSLEQFYNPFPWIAIAYFTFRALGKIFGTYGGALSLGIEEPMRSGLGLALVAQGGIVLALASRTVEVFTSIGNAQLGERILSLVILSTILSEIFGALGVDFAIKRNDEQFKAKSPLMETQNNQESAMDSTNEH